MRPRLIGPELLTILPVDRAATRVDPLLDEPIGTPATSTPVAILAQVDELRDGVRMARHGGSEVPVLWTFTFRRVDLDRLGYAPKPGDRVVSRAQRSGSPVRAVELYIVNATDSGEILSGRSLVEADATDRHPSRWASEGGP